MGVDMCCGCVPWVWVWVWICCNVGVGGCVDVVAYQIAEEELAMNEQERLRVEDMERQERETHAAAMMLQVAGVGTRIVMMSS